MIDKGISAIVFDCGTLLRWNRPMVGIVRIQFEVASYLLQSSYKTIFIAFDAKKQNILTIQKDILQAKLASLKQCAPIPKRLSFSRLRSVPKRIKNFTDSLQDTKILSFLERAKKRTHRLKSYTEGLHDELAALSLPRISRNMRNIFNKESLLITMGLDWEDSNYALLSQLKHEIGFRVVGLFCDGFILKNPQWAVNEQLLSKFMLHFYYLSYMCNVIISISEYSKAEFYTLLNTFNIDVKPDVHVFYPGSCYEVEHDNDMPSSLPVMPTIKLKHDPLTDELVSDDVYHHRITKEAHTKNAHSRPYALYVSTIEPRKNHILLLNIWEFFITHHIQAPDLVLVGMRGWGGSDFWDKYHHNEALRKKVFWYDNINDDALDLLYQQAHFSLFPSFDEGFGIGAAQSLAHGVPVLISNSAGLIEATQNLMPSLDANDSNAWIEWILKLTNDHNQWQQLRAKARQFKPNSWHNFTQSLMNVVVEGGA